MRALWAGHLFGEATLNDLVDGDHHGGEGEEQAQAQGRLDDGGAPPRRQVEGDDVMGHLAKCNVSHLYIHHWSLVRPLDQHTLGPLPTVAPT